MTEPSLSASRSSALATAAQHYLDATPWADDPREAALPTVGAVQATRRELESFLRERGAP